MNLEKRVNDSFLKKGLRKFERFAFPLIFSSVLLIGGCGKKGEEAPTSPSGNQPPTVEIISGPSNGSTIYENEATFAWQGYDEDGDIVGYEYKLPPKINDYDYTIFEVLTFIFLEDDENYTLYVKAKDNGGAYSSPATRSFNVDLQGAGSSGTTNQNGEVTLVVNNNSFDIHVSSLTGNDLQNVSVAGEYSGGNDYIFLAEKLGYYYSNSAYLEDYTVSESKGERSLDDLINISMKGKTSSPYYSEGKFIPYSMANNPDLEKVETETLSNLEDVYEQYDDSFEDVILLEFVLNYITSPDITLGLAEQFRNVIIGNSSNVTSIINDVTSSLGSNIDVDAVYFDFYKHKTLDILTHDLNKDDYCTVKGVVKYNNNAVGNAYVTVVSGPTIKSDYTSSSGEYILKFLNEGNYNFKATYSGYEDLESKVVNAPTPPNYISTYVNFNIESQQQQTITIQPGPSDGKDAYVELQVMTSGDTLHANENYGDETSFYVRNYYNPYASWTTLVMDMSFIQFNIPPYVEDVANATLCMHGVGNSSDPITVEVRRVTNNWNENTITWNNQPNYSSYVYDAEIIPASNTSDWNYFDVTELVQKWIDGVYSNYGFVLIIPQPGPWNQTFSFWGTSGDNTIFPSYRPKLEITYE